MTNWDAAGVFSRVFPIFRTPEKAGDYAVCKIKNDYLDYRLGDALSLDSLSPKERQRIEKRKRKALKKQGSILDDSIPELTFYPEGGQLVRGLTSTVAFEYSLPDTAVMDFSGYLLDSRGDTLSPVQSIREGRGIFTCIPDTGRLSLTFLYDGRRYIRLLPLAEDSGFVLHVNATSSGRVHASVSSTPSLYGRLLGLALRQGGRVVAFDTLRSGASPVLKSFDRGSLPSGVNQLTLFDASGRVWADRLFFVCPDTLTDIAYIQCCFSDSAIAPYRQESLSISGPPSSVVSVSVQDAGSMTNGYRGNVASWLLLSSELKGFIRHADYYLEADDAVHRRDADLLMLVQGWRRYDWRMMSGCAPFIKRQPLEDALYLDGQLLPRRKRQKVTDISLKATLYNRYGGVLKGEALTDSLGYYAFRLPDFVSRWNLFLVAAREDKRENFRITVNRRFSPERKSYLYAESELLQPIAPYRYFRSDSSSVSSLTPSYQPSYTLGGVTVKGRRAEGRRGWEVSRNYAEERSQFYFNMDAVVDSYLDRGEDCPFLFDWLMSIPAFSKDYYSGKRGIAWVYEDVGSYLPIGTDLEKGGSESMGQSMSAAPIRLPKSHKPRASVSLYPERVVGNRIYGDYADAEFGKEGAPLVTLDEVKEVYVSLDHGVSRYLSEDQKERLARFDPIHVFVYPHYSFGYKVKGLRSTYVDGYSIPRTFHMKDYSHMLKEADYRRTLYWNPNVELDADGKAEVTFWNNATCKEVHLSVEGLTSDGKPLLNKEN